MDTNLKLSSNRSRNKNDETIKMLFDIQTLDFYCRYVISTNKNIKTSHLALVKELFNRVDESAYRTDLDRLSRIKFIKRGLEARLKKKLIDKNLIIQYINGGPLNKPLLDTSNMEEISDEILAYLNDQAAELVKFYFVDEKYDQILNLAASLHTANYQSRSETISKIQEITSDLNLHFNRVDDSVTSSQIFTLVPGEFEMAMSDIYFKETNPSRILKTGMVGLNIMLDGGFQANRVYLLLAQAAGGKSFTMLDLAMQIKKYNKDLIPKDPTKIPTIVFLTMENSEVENASRLLGMVSGGKTFNDYSLDASLDVFRNNGLGYSKDDPIDIMMIYKPNLSINTDYLYALVDKLRESGREPICVFQDHIKRIRPTNKRNDLRLDLGEIINEFKAFANEFEIPVITDSHLNREASRTLDENVVSNKKDLIRSLGSFNVSESFLMIDNCDVGIIINKEMDAHELLHMGFKCIKTRTKCDLDLFYQPYQNNNTIKLVEDVDDVVPSLRRSLKDDMVQMTTISRFSRRNDFNPNSIHSRKLDDDELFSPSVLGVSRQSDEEILYPSEPIRAFTINRPIETIYGTHKLS